MKWNWQHNNWPEFDYDATALNELEARFVAESSKLIGASGIITEDDKRRFTIDLMSEEAQFILKHLRQHVWRMRWLLLSIGLMTAGRPERILSLP